MRRNWKINFQAQEEGVIREAKVVFIGRVKKRPFTEMIMKRKKTSKSTPTRGPEVRRGFSKKVKRM